MTDFPAVFQTLAAAQVEFIVIGGSAATAHGSARLTQDVDIVYARDVENVERRTTGPALLVGRAGDPARPQLHVDDCPHTQELMVFGTRCRCLTIEKLIEVKRAAGRPKDFEAIAELEIIREQMKLRGS